MRKRCTLYHCARIGLIRQLVMGLVVACLMANAGPAVGREVFASVFGLGGIDPSDPDPTLTGVIKIDLETGVATPFIPEGTANLFVLSDVAVGPHDGLLYVSTQIGTIERFDGMTGSHAGNFAFFPGPEGSDGVNTLQFDTDGTLYAATGSGVIAKFDPSGNRLTDVASGLTFPSGIAIHPSGDLLAAVGQTGGPGEVLRFGSSGVSTLIPSGSIGGGSGLTVRAAVGDYDSNAVTNSADYDTWVADFGAASIASDGNQDGIVDAADYTLWRDNLGDESQLIVADLFGNQLYGFNLNTETGGQLTTIDLPLPNPPPPGAIPSNSPSEVIVTQEGTFLVSTLGPTQRPFNNGAVLEYDFEGNLLQEIRTNLPPLSGIALVPEQVVLSGVPEPGSAVIIALGLLSIIARGRR